MIPIRDTVTRQHFPFAVLALILFFSFFLHRRAPEPTLPASFA